MTLIQTLDHEINGYWDGRAKKIFEWTIEPFHGGKDSQGEFVRVGSWEANHWFHIAKGRTEKLTLRNALLHLKAAARKNGINATFTYKEAN